MHHEKPESPAAHAPRAWVIDRDGVRAVAEPVAPEAPGAEPQARLHLAGGRTLLVPARALAAQHDGTYRVPFVFATAAGTPQPAQAPPAGAGASARAVLPVLEERLDVGRRARETGRVRVHKRVESRPVVVDEPLERVGVEVVHVPVNRYLREPVGPHYDGDTLVLPVMEEVVVVERRLVLREHVRVTPQRSSFRAPQTVPVRREVVEVERDGAPPAQRRR